MGQTFEKAGHGRVEYEQDQPGLIISKWKAQPDDPIYDIGFLTRDPTVRAGNAGLVEILSDADIPLLKECRPGRSRPAVPASRWSSMLSTWSTTRMASETRSTRGSICGARRCAAS